MPTDNTPTTTDKLTQQQVSDAVAKHYDKLFHKVQDGIRYKLRITVPKEEVLDLLNDMVLNMLERHAKGLLDFQDDNSVVGYLLRGAWFNYRTLAGKMSNHNKKNRKSAAAEWAVEEHQLIGHGEKYDVSIDHYNDMGSHGVRQFAHPALLTYQEDERSGTEQDYRDDYYAELWAKLFDYLDDSVADGEFKFDEVSLYKSYILNDYTIKDLVATSNYKRSYVSNAVRKIKAHIANVDWFIKPRE